MGAFEQILREAGKNPEEEDGEAEESEEITREREAEIRQKSAAAASILHWMTSDAGDLSTAPGAAPSLASPSPSPSPSPYPPDSLRKNQQLASWLQTPLPPKPF